MSGLINNVCANSLVQEISTNIWQLMCFAGSTSSSWDDCVWTVQALLPEWASPKYVLTSRMSDENGIKFVCQHLNVDYEPRVSTVARHLQRLTTLIPKHVLQESASVEILSQSLRSCYAFLNTRSAWNSQEIVDLLALVPCVLDKERHVLVRPNQSVTNLGAKREIFPYLISLPLDLGAYCALFHSLGTAKNDPKLSQYVAVLKEVAENAQGKYLECNERSAVCRAIEQVLELVDESESDSNLQLDDELYLPGDDWIMHKSSELIYDNIGIGQSLDGLTKPLLISLKDKCGLSRNFDVESLLKKLPSSSQPEFLSDVVHEEIQGNYTIVDDSPIAMRLARHLSSEQFRHGVARLIADRSQAAGNRRSEEQLMQLVERINNIRIQGVDKLTTCFHYMGRPVGEARFTNFTRKNIR
jgi:hypothetical protein